MVAIVLHIAMGYVIFVSGLIVPPAMVALMLVAWVLLAGRFITISRRRANPWWYLTVPGSAVAMWLVVAFLGGALLDWSA